MMEEMINLLVNNGVAVTVVIYFMYRDWKFQETLQQTLTTLVDTVDALKDTINSNKGAIL